ncbi:hypothetical protein BZA05DRAFT_448627 [Tricharina praecox]|uniref:uncharacterized protein n=1 Tax=Tricharina praecox TaxID=43433 RepID=UPI00221EA374|nr:uncharacterized protein BZA05DRAFT_448627 [Tricharina praecox]KAI5843715.1 hypothetical protein BZA05DRAFT_448627 [Tricharina praecox]
MASAPAVERVGVWVAGCTMWVSCEMGVTVWMLLEGFDKLIQEKRKPTDGGRRFLWDHKTYPLAGFRILPELCDASGSGSMVVTPEFFDTQAIIAELRDGGWVRESSRVPFCFELPE